MDMTTSWLLSLLLTGFFGFTASCLVLTILLVTLQGLSLLPYIDSVGQTSSQSLTDFLAIFGQGQPLEGVLVISVTCSLVSLLFEIYVLYQQQSWRKP